MKKCIYAFLVSVLSSFLLSSPLVAAKIVEECNCYSTLSNPSYHPIHDIANIWIGYNAWARDLEFKKANQVYIYVGYEEYVQLYSNYLGLAAALKNRYQYPRETIKEFYSSELHRICEFYEDLMTIYHNWNFAERNFVHDRRIWHGMSSGHYVCPEAYEKDMQMLQRIADYDFRRIRENRDALKLLYQKVFSLCQRNHTSLRTLYEMGFHHIKLNNNLEAMDHIHALIKGSKKSNSSKYLGSKTFERLGIACSLSLEYNEAVEALTEAINKDPENKNAYFERAAAYFELKQFDLAVRDYILSGKEGQLVPSRDSYKLQFSQGLVMGARQGLYVATIEMPSSLLHSISGLGQLLWVSMTDPEAVAEKLIDATIKLVEYLRKEDISKVAQHMAPEVHDLVTNWANLDHKTRGEKTGFILGKYGVNILSGYGGTKAIQACTALREMNALSNLRTLTVSNQHRLEMIRAAEQASQLRARACASKKVHMGKQGKHIPGHNSYETLPASEKARKSIWTHPEVEKKIEPFIGKGQPVIESPTMRGYIEPGAPGYRERVDFGEVIGFFIDEKDMNKKIITTRATIHHSNDGVHAVPCRPKEFDRR